LYSAFGTREVADIFRPFNDYKVLLEIGPQFQETSEDLQHLYLRAGNGALVPMSTFASLAASVGPLTITTRASFPPSPSHSIWRPGPRLATPSTASSRSSSRPACRPPYRPASRVMPRNSRNRSPARGC
jgi:multidrug efflux pump